MALFYADQYAMAMHNYFGGHGNWEDYRFWAFNGLAMPHNDPVLSDGQWNEVNQGWDSIKDNIEARSCQ